VNPMIWAIGIFLLMSVLSGAANAQAGVICENSGGIVWLNSKVVYGRVLVNGGDPNLKLPKVTVTLQVNGNPLASATIDRTGNYCFRDVDGGGGTLIVEVEGTQVGQEMLPYSRNLKQFRQDFEITTNHTAPLAKPGVVTAKSQTTRSEKNARLYEMANAAIKEGKPETALAHLKEIVAADANDFVAWGMIGSLHYDRNEYSEAELAYKKALAAKPNLSQAMMNIGRINLLQNRPDPAIEYILMATKSDPTSARAFQLLGEAYLVAKKGTLGIAAFNEAIRLAPVAMAECHLLIARVYDLAGARNLASREYRMFLEKVPNHPDKAKLTKYISDNPDLEK
jgi:Tfp pilus assembly protein PilF